MAHKQYKVLVMIGVVLILFSGIFLYLYYYQNNTQITQQQYNIFLRGIDKAEKDIRDFPRQPFGYLDKAEYLRQLGKNKEALRVLGEAYKILDDWRSTPDFLLVEARIYSSIDEKKAIDRYERLLSEQQLNESLYAEYINFLKNSGQSRLKVVDWYERFFAKIPNSNLRSEYESFLNDGAK